MIGRFLCVFTRDFQDLPNLSFNGIIPSLTVGKTKNRCKPYDYRATAIFAIVTNYSNLFFSLTFFLNCSHFTFGYELIIGSETADIMKVICDRLPFV